MMSIWLATLHSNTAEMSGELFSHFSCDRPQGTRKKPLDLKKNKPRGLRISHAGIARRLSKHVPVARVLLPPPSGVDCTSQITKYNMTPLGFCGI